MALISRPLATDGLIVIPAQTLARGGRLSGQLDLRTKLGGYAFIRIGRQGANALTNGVSVLLGASRTVARPDGGTLSVSSCPVLTPRRPAQRSASTRRAAVSL